jgi:hypothetical protein
VLSDICGDQPLSCFSPDFADMIASLTGGSAGAAPMAPEMGGSSIRPSPAPENPSRYGERRNSSSGPFHFAASVPPVSVTPSVRGDRRVQSKKRNELSLTDVFVFLKMIVEDRRLENLRTLSKEFNQDMAQRILTDTNQDDQMA